MTHFTLRSSAVLFAFFFSAVAAAWAAIDLKVFDDRGRQRDIDAVIAAVSDAHAVFIGENHDRYDQHLGELEIIRRLYERDPERWAIGVEFIQKPFQSALDAYISGAISEREFLERSEYFDRWGFDFRLYRPIFQFAKEHMIPMVALNADRELVEKTGKVGLEGLSVAERDQLPRQIDKSDRDYRKRIEKIFKQHPEATGGNFEHFWEAQLVWDETMGESAAEYLSAHPGKSIVVLAGSGHMEFGSGIPSRVRRRLPGIQTAILLTTDKPATKRHEADYSLVSRKEELPPAPKMGIVMDFRDGVRVKSLTPGGPAATSGIQPQDRIMKIGDQNVNSVGDLRLALMDRNPGDRIALHIRRGSQDLDFEVVLQ